MKKTLFAPLLVVMMVLWGGTVWAAQSCNTNEDCDEGYMCINGYCSSVVQDGDVEDFSESDADVVETADGMEKGDSSSQSESAANGSSSSDSMPTGRCDTSSDCPNGYACFDGICLYTECLVDDDCPGKRQICMDNGYCVPETCNQDSDCLYPDIVCRSDNQCAPKVCRYDTDCTYYSYCSNGECKPNPAFYVHGKGCTSSNSAWLLFLLPVVGLILFRIRRREPAKF